MGMNPQVSEPAGDKPEASPQVSTGADAFDKIYKAISELQNAVKELATGIGIAAESQRGLQETVGQMKAAVEKFSVGMPAAAAENAAGASAGAASTTPGAESVETPPKNLKEPAESLYQKGEKEVAVPERKDVVKKITTVRPDVGANTTAGKETDDKGTALIRGLLDGSKRPVDVRKALTEGI